MFSFIIFSNVYEVFASAWLIDSDQHRYSATINMIDNYSKAQKQQRANLYLQVQQKLECLREHIIGVNTTSARYKSLFNQIQILEKECQLLSSYQDDRTSTFTIEYGVSKNQNFGIQLLYKNNIFQDSQNINYISNTKQIDLFYKIKLFQNNNFVISIQPQIIMIKDKGCKQQLLYELSLLSGLSKEIHSMSIFTEGILSVGYNLNCNKKIYYSFATSQGVKFKNGIMFVHFTKYHIRRNYNLIYNNTFYEQFSIAKNINFFNLKQGNLTMQVGYFWDRSIIKKLHQSGTIFSIWLDI